MGQSLKNQSSIKCEKIIFFSFSRQKKAEWVAVIGSIRLGSSSPWNQERRIIGMIKSPVEGSSLVLIKMNEPVVFSDFVRPVCLSDANATVKNFTCVALGWSTHGKTYPPI